MTSRFTSTTLALLIGTLGAAAHAQTSSRDEAREALRQAVRDGTLMHGEAGSREAAPVGAVTRATVRAEFDAARRNGDLLAAGEASPTVHAPDALRDAPTTVAAKTRAQVRAEVVQAQRNGELLAAGEAAFMPRPPQRAMPTRDAAAMLAGAPADARTAH